MTSSNLVKKSLVTGSIFLALAVVFGAFGAHALKAFVEADKLQTFETGVRYQFYHGLGIILAGLFAKLFPETKLDPTFFAFSVGILLFSFNCYFYVLSGMKVFAMIVPVGGLLFIAGWAIFIWNALKLR